MRRAAVAILVALLSSISVATAEVRWRSGPRVAPTRGTPEALGGAVAALAERPDRSHVVAHFDGPVDPEARELLGTRGLRLLSYLGDNAYFASLEPAVDAAAVASSAGFEGVEAIATLDKLHPDLAGGIVHPWTIVKAVAEDATSADPEVAVYVLFHSDVDAEARAAEIAGRHGGAVVSLMRAVNGVVVHLRSSRVAGLAGEDAVMWVESPLPALTAVNDGNRPRIGADVLAGAPYGLDGSGVTVLVYDSGQVFAHGDFTGRLTIGASDTSGVSDHSTHVAGTVGGDGAGSAGQFRGMAPAVEIVSFGFEQEGGLQQGFLYTDPGDVESDYAEAINVYDVDLSNNSIGSNTAPNGFPCEWEGDYGVTAALIDEIVRGSTGAPFRVVWAAGNERQGTARCGATYNTTAPPANAKNHITVGAMNSNDDSVTDFTSWGPSDDGRLKPDISGPGCQGGGDGGVTSTSSSGGYNVKCGTSMASPTVAGVAALLLQQYRTAFPGEPDFRNSTLKAILANTAEDLQNIGPDFQTGYGSVRAAPAADLIIEERFVEAEVAQGEVYAFIVVVGPIDTELIVTMAWDDPSGTPNVSPALVNDLDLRVIDTANVVHLPWTLDPLDPAAPAVRTVRDGLNNIEQVVIDNPAPGAYVVEVEGFNVAAGASQTFGAAASPSLIDCSSAGTLTTGRSRIMCSGVLDLRVVDCDLNTDDGVVETTSVDAVSGSEPAGETVVLTESAPEAAELLGSVAVNPVDATGVLQVTEGDTITVTYIDADDGAGGTNVAVVRSVVVDCTPPSITGVVVSEINPRDATVDVSLSEPARVTVSFGTVCGAPTGSASGSGFDTTHPIALLGLSDDSTYFFAVEAEDEAGNVATDDNSGACYTFTTPQVPDFLTEQFGSGLDLEGLSITFEPDAGIDFYGRCVESLFGLLPTDPAGGTNLGLGDDQPVSIGLTDGQSVSLYGQSHSTMWVGPNGYVTFGSGDSTYNESFSDHFSLPRVAALFDDLDPGVGGSVTWKQLSDRVAVTWEDVPELSTSNTNTFQIEMFFDGRIRMSWLDVDVADAIVGLSEGVGLDPGFLASDISDQPSCPPRPPFVQDLSVVTGQSTPVAITLLGGDDGQPAPPVLVHRVTSLPIVGTLKDGVTGLIIAAVPYDLAGGGNVVTYTPPGGFQGLDAFGYTADDGGTPPDGGAAPTAAVDIVIGNSETLLEFLVDDTDPGWTTTGDWAFGQPTGAGSHNGDPVSGATGSNVYGYNLAGDYTDVMGQEFLTSLPVDLGAKFGTTFEFQRWLGVESATYDHATVQISTDGSSWITIWDHNDSSEISDTAWSLQSFDISSITDDEPAVSFRWIMGTTDGSVTYPGWNIDDVRIEGIDSSASTPCTFEPGEVPSLRFTDDPSTLVWLPAPYVGGTNLYDVIRSEDPDDFRRQQSGATCIDSNSPDTIAVDTTVPAAGQVFFYLVRPENECDEGPLGGGHTGLGC